MRRPAAAATFRTAFAAGALLLALALSGCAVVTVAGAAASVAATTVSVGASAVGLAADAAIGTARVTGKAVGAVLPGGDD